MASVNPYDGDRPYIFISYAHANSPAVMEVVQELHDHGFRIWYDDGIEVGSEWQENIAEHLAKASLMIAFVSNAYMRSDNCRKEMHYAVSKKKNLINIFLEETALTPGMEMQIGNLFALMKYTMSDDVFFQKLWNAPQLNPELLAEGASSATPRPRAKKSKKLPIDLTVEQQQQRKRKTRRYIRLAVFLALLLALAIFGIVAWSTGLAHRIELLTRQEELVLLPDDTVANFRNEVFERAAREYSGISEGELRVSDLVGLTELYIYGDQYSLTSYESVFGNEGAGSIDDLIVKPLVGRWRPTRDPEIGIGVDIVNGYRGGRFGFFSAHASNTFSIAIFLTLVIRSRLLGIALVLWSLLNCWTRVYLGVHYPGDILVGLLWGGFVGTLVWYLYTQIEKQNEHPANFISSQYTKTGYQHEHIHVAVSVLAFTLVYAIIKACFSLYI